MMQECFNFTDLYVAVQLSLHQLLKVMRDTDHFSLSQDITLRTLDWRRKWQPTPVFLPGESQGWQNLVGCCLWGRTESDTTEAT